MSISLFTFESTKSTTLEKKFWYFRGSEPPNPEATRVMRTRRSGPPFTNTKRKETNMMNTTLMMTSGRAAIQAAVKSSVQTSALISRPSLFYLGRRSFSAQMQKHGNNDKEMLHEKTTHPSKTNKGQEMEGYREYLDKMMNKTSKMESSMQALQDTYAQKKRHVYGSTIKWMDASDIDRLFDESSKHKQDISTELSELKSILQDARQDARYFYGVDAPDGESDWHVHEEMQEINHIIEDAAVLEDKDEVMRRHEMKAEAARIFAVDAPDGDPDGHVQEEVHEVQHIIDNTTVLKGKTPAINRKHKM
jgi:hypothetical protein